MNSLSRNRLAPKAPVILADVVCPSSGSSVNTAFTSSWSHFQHLLVFNVNCSNELYRLFIAIWSVHLVEILPTLHFPVRNRYFSTFWSAMSIGHTSFIGCLLPICLSIWWRFFQPCTFRCVISSSTFWSSNLLVLHSFKRC